ncbi:BolA/IbaG family iron-sulfur metabolism protein [Candidatus Fukatsuia anoeciicola]|uniref:BolA/IbaG family iron-sulfur metabolism protein n=1 Tax=Candidatus Fukatsuia anoeciicola TaxID=2994492 RepID=UPI0034638B6C
MHSITSRIEKKLKENFKPIYLKVINESFRHNVPAETETHFKVIIISDKFSNQILISRHREIYNLLAQEFKEGLHALVLHAHTQKEWKNLQYNIINSSSCHNDKNYLNL